MELIIAKHYYWIIIILVLIGLYAMMTSTNLVKKVIGLNIFQTAVFLLLIVISTKEGGTLPILIPYEYLHLFPDPVPYVNPLPHVMILTAIVVGVSITAVALALVIRINIAYGTIDEDEIARIEQDS
ncbi:cation:proton antiporter subunit C [Thermodesulfovibrionales bacterium]|nr:cation:proton antiporter subunit C [Thermodesulfovibrionales bacterium]